MDSRKIHLITRERFDAVLFDLDGVLTDTAGVHAAAWKKLFDDLLERRRAAGKEPFHPFDISRDYRLLIDGRLRYDGVRNFLESRNIDLPYGDPKAPPNYDTITGLGNIKNAVITELIATRGVDVYAGSVAFVKKVREQGIRTAVVSASRNCSAALKAGGIAHLFEVRVDGEIAERLKLPGKPEPDTFLEAARELGVKPERAAVIEDALSGVRAGRAGKFGLVIGVDRKGEREALLNSGADLVVNDLDELL